MGVDYGQKIAAIDAKISNTKTQILALESRDDLSRDERKMLYLLRKELVELEGEQTRLSAALIQNEKAVQAEQAEAIKEKRDAIRTNFEQIRGFLSPSILTDYPDLQRIVSEGLDLLSTNKADLPASRKIEALTVEALEYLKNPQNREVLAAISSGLKDGNPEQYLNFRNFLVGQDADFEHIFQDLEDRSVHIDIALEGGAVRKVSGNTVYGNEGEILDLSGSVPKLSLEASDGLILPVTEIHAAHTEAAEKEVADLRVQIDKNRKTISQNEAQILRYQTMVRDISEFDPARFENPASRRDFINQLIAANPELVDLEPDIFFEDNGSGFVGALVQKISEHKDLLVQQTEILKAETAKLVRDAGILSARVTSQKRIAKEKVRVQKERVRSSARFIEVTGSSKLVHRLQSVFARISVSNPVHLPNGDIITAFDPSLFQFG